MTRGGYALVTRRSNPDDLINDLHRGYGAESSRVRIRESFSNDYEAPLRSPWNLAPDGVDVLVNRDLIKKTFPSYASDVATVIHIRRAGSISAQQLGQFMLEQFRANGGRLIRAELKGISTGSDFELELDAGNGPATIRASRVVNAAGPYLRDVAKMLGEDLPVKCVFQQKISFEDREGAILRDMPFTIDLDGQTLTWDKEDRELLASDPTTRHYTEPKNGGIHCRPDGAVNGKWIKLGWAYNEKESNPHAEEPIDPHFPDTVLRGASRLNPKLAAYIGKLPSGVHHYGGFYTMTEENWPLIGKMKTEGAFVAGALSGYGSMAACAAGELCASWVTGQTVPDYALSLGINRYADKAFMAELARFGKGSL